ncbi:ATP-binding protein [Peribacillus sp. NPDC097206]|uniref:ATP-binding protein n=1 Tax=Peribacillus sp. NPDC097206 TaxID=3364398 RepID=UPI00381FBCBD
MKETEARQTNLLSKRMKSAKLPFMKTNYDFDYSFQPSVSKERVKETLTYRFIANGENRILLGPPGVGKTHLAISFAVEALTQGYTALFFTANEVGIGMPKGRIQRGTLPPR